MLHFPYNSPIIAVADQRNIAPKSPPRKLGCSGFRMGLCGSKGSLCDKPVLNARMAICRSKLGLAAGQALKRAASRQLTARDRVLKTVVKSLTQSSDGNGIARVLQRRICV